MFVHSVLLVAHSLSANIYTLLYYYINTGGDDEPAGDGMGRTEKVGGMVNQEEREKEKETRRKGEQRVFSLTFCTDCGYLKFTNLYLRTDLLLLLALSSVQFSVRFEWSVYVCFCLT